MAPPPRVALTIDAEHPDRPQCPPGAQEEIVELLTTKGVQATFFLQGRWVQAYPDLARGIADGGHVIGSHGYYHVRMPLLSDEGLRVDIRRAEEEILAATGVDPKPWFRCPFGIGADDPRVLAAVTELDYRHVAWDVTAFDWENDRTTDDVKRAVVEQSLDHGDGAVILLHTWTALALNALPGIIDDLQDKGARFVGIDELLTGAD
jgi:peptidoglycan-N-acetylglucosamine deacetylase